MVPRVRRVGAAAAAFLTLNYEVASPVTLTYRVNNGHRRTERWPFGTCAVQNGENVCGQKTIALPLRLSDLRAGDNLIRIGSSGPTIISNVDLILHSAGGVVAPSVR